MATYCATKFGVVGLSAALREEVRPHGIAVCAILPGIVHTEWDETTECWENFVSVEPGDIAAAVVKAAQNQRAMSYVPRRMRWALRTGLAMPQRPRRFFSRISRTEQAYLAVDHAIRDAYHARAGAGD